MNREELNAYIDNCYLMGNVVDESNQLVNAFCQLPDYPDPEFLLDSVCIDGLYFKKDEENKIHLIYCDTKGKDLDLGDCVDVIDDTCNGSLQFINITMNSVKVLPMWAFMNTPVQTFRGDEVEVVEERAFCGCTKLRKLILPKAKVIFQHGSYSYSRVKIIAPKECKFIVV